MRVLAVLLSLFVLSAVSFSVTNVTGCMVISSNDTYNLNTSLSGANISASPVTGLACIKIAVSNVTLDCNGFNITNNGTAGTTYGILLNGSVTNVTVKNCPLIGSYINGVYLNTGSNNNTLINNTVYNSTSGFLVQGSNGNNLTNNTFFNSTSSTTVGFAINSGSNNVLINNTAIKANCAGFSLSSSSNNRLTNNIAINASSIGCSAPAAFSLAFSSLNVLTNNTAINSINGFALSFSGNSNNNLTNNIAINSSSLGFAITSSTSNRLSNNTVIFSDIGYEIASATGPNILNNNTATNSNIGFFVASSAGTAGNLTNNLAINSSIHGFAFNTSSNIILANNTAINSGSHGFDFTSSGGNTIANNTATNSSIGFSVNVSDTFTLINNFTGNTAFNSSGSGISIIGNNTRLTRDHFYNNNPDFTISGTGIVVNLTNVIFDNPLGDFTNYTNLSLNDTVSSAYTIDHSTQAAALPASLNSFANKYVNITVTNGTVSLDRVIWHWIPGELGGFSESNFQLWKFNSSGWGTVNTTPNITTHTLSLANHNPASVYAILVSAPCQVITSPGSYQLSDNALGAPNDAAPLTGSACVKIASSDVSFNCNGFNMTNNGTAGDTFGFLVNGTFSNVTIRNCPGISQYTYGVHFLQSNQGEVTNSSLFNNSFGLFVREANNTNLTSSRVFNNSFGVYLNNSQAAIFTRNNITGNANGLYVLDSNLTRLSSDRFANNSIDLAFNSTSSSLRLFNLTTVIFDNPASNLTNYTNLSLNDSTSSASAYLINWSGTPAPAPPGYVSFSGKYLSLDNLTPGVSIDRAVWHWQTSELGIFNESRLTLFWYNGTEWALLNDSPNTGANHLSLSGISTFGSFGSFGLLENNGSLSNCSVLAFPGSYYLTGSINGAPNPAPALPGSSCMLVTSSRVNLDCGGFNITNNQSGTTYGILLSGPITNVSIRNCGISNYTFGAYLSQSNRTNITGSRINGNSRGIYVLDSNLSNISLTRFYNNSLDYQVNNTGGASLGMGMLNVTFDNPAGNFGNLTNLTISDSVSAGSSYSINWSAQPPAPFPASFSPFAGKFVNITTLAGTVSIDSVQWRWADNEVVLPLLESHFELWKYNSSGWTVMNFTPNTATNTLSVQNLNVTSVFGILNNNCPEITSPGAYQMTENFLGFPNPSVASSTFPIAGASCVLINSNHVDFDCNGFNITGRGLLSSYFHGILINQTASNVTIRNCPGVMNFTVGIYALNSTGVTILNTTAHHNAGPGIFFDNTNGSSINNVTVYNNSFTYSGGNMIISGNGNNITNSAASIITPVLGGGPAGFTLFNASSNNSFINDTATNNSIGFESFCDVEGCIGNTYFNNTATGGVVGIRAFGSNSSIMNNTAGFISFGGAFIISGIGLDIRGNLGHNLSGGSALFSLFPINYSIVEDNAAYNSSGKGIQISGNNNVIANNTADANGDVGFEIFSSDSNITGNNASNSIGYDISLTGDRNLFARNLATGTGFFIFGSANQAANNTANGSSGSGFRMGGENATVSGNTALNIDFRGFDASFGSLANSIFRDNIAQNVSGEAFSFSTGSDNNTLINNTAVSSGTGFSINSINTTLINNTVSGSSACGLMVSTLSFGTNLTFVSGDHYYNNSPDICISGSFSDHLVSLSGVILDSPSGTFENFTSISLNDTVQPVDFYTLRRSSSPAPYALPGGYRSFDEKFVNISGTAGSTVDAIVWHWDDSELSGTDNESNFTLFKFNDTAWLLLNATPDSSGNTLSLFNHTVGSVYGILQNGTQSLPDCPIIVAPGYYKMSANFSGARTDPVTGQTACVHIRSSGVDFDCAGFGMANNGSTASGILFPGVSNSTVRNCANVSGYQSGVLLTGTNSSSVINNTFFGSNESGASTFCGGLPTTFGGSISLDGSHGNLVKGNIARNGKVNGIFLYQSSNNTIRDNFAQDNFDLADILGNTFHGIVLSESDSNQLINNSAFRNGQNNDGSGFLLCLASNNLLENNSAYNNSAEGFTLENGSENNFTNNSAYSNLDDDGFDFSDANSTTAVNNRAFNNADSGLQISNSNRTVVIGDHYFANLVDFRANALPAGSVLNLSNVIFDSPSGNFTNFTNFSLNETASSIETFVIDHSAPVPTLPFANYTSFAGKYVLISGGPTLDKLVWHWDDSELTVHNESKLELWKFISPSNWTLMNASPDMVSNTLSLTAHPASLGTFAILDNGSLLGSPASINVTKTVLSPSASPGGIVRFNITVTNTGALNFTSVQVNDTLPSGLTFLSASPSNSSGSGQSMTWNLGALTTGSTTSILLNATVDSGIVNATNRTVNLTNSVNASGQPTFGANATASTSATVTVFHSNISVTKAFDNSTSGLVKFNITIVNNGNVTLNPVSVNDSLPAGLVFLSSVPANSSGSGSAVIWSNVGPIAPGANTTIRMNATVTTAGNYTNNVSVVGVPPNGANVTQNASVSFSAAASPANVSIIKLNQTSLVPSPGGIVQFNITVTNNGGQSLNPVTVTDILPSGFTFLAASPANSSGSGSTVIWDVGPLPVSATAVLRLNATVDPGVVSGGVPLLNLTNVVNVSGQPTSGPNVTANSSVNVTAYYTNVSIFKLSQTSQPASPGGIVQFNITINNTGNVTLNPVRVVDVLPSGLTYLSASPLESSLVGQTVTWNNIGPLAPGTGTVIFLNATAGNIVNATNTTRDLTNLVNVSGAPPNGANATSNTSANVTIFYANLSVLKLDQTAIQASPGGRVQFNITVTNTGNLSLNGTVNDTLPAGLTFLSAFPLNISSGPRWTYTGLAPGASTVFYVNATVNQGIVSAGTPLLNLTNSVTAGGVPQNGNGRVANSSANVTIFYANLSVTKTNINPIPPSPGGLSQWQIVVANTGNVTLDPVLVNDTIQAGMAFGSASPAPSAQSGQSVNWSVGPLAPGASTTIFLNTTVPTAGTFVNNATARGSPPNGNNVSDSDGASVGVSVPSVSVIKTINDSTVGVGEKARFKLNITNTGATDLNITVKDVLPAGVNYMEASVAETSNSSGTVIWENFITISPGGSTLLFYNATILSAGSYSNDVNVTGVPPSGNNVSDTDSVAFTGLPPNVSITKTVASSAVPVGNNATFTVTVTNTGATNLTITVTDTFDPLNSTYQGANLTETSNAGGVVTWANAATLAPSSAFSVKFNLSVDVPGVQVNRVNVTAAPPVGANVTDNDSVNFGINPAVSAPSEGGNEEDRPLEISVSNSCDGANITVTSEGTPVSGVHITVSPAPGFGGYSIADDTDSNGKVVVTEDATLERIHASKSGYSTAILTTEVGRILCITEEARECRQDSDCNFNQYCILPSNEGDRFGPPSTYSLLPFFASCVDDNLAVETDFDEIPGLCSAGRPDTVQQVQVVTGGEDCGSPLDPSYCSRCSAACNLDSDCPVGTRCSHPEGDFSNIRLGFGVCSLSVDATGRSNYQRCNVDSDCARGSYCENFYGICVLGCKEGHTLNCESGNYCQLDIGENRLSTVDRCVPGCISNDDCAWYQYCDSAGSSPGSCQNLGCGSIESHHLIGDEYQCGTGGIIGPGEEPNPECACEQNQFCNTSAYGITRAGEPRYGSCQGACGVVRDNELVEEWQCDPQDPDENPYCAPCASGQDCSDITHECVSDRCNTNADCEAPYICENVGTDPSGTPINRCVLYYLDISPPSHEVGDTDYYFDGDIVNISGKQHLVTAPGPLGCFLCQVNIFHRSNSSEAFGLLGTLTLDSVGNGLYSVTPGEYRFVLLKGNQPEQSISVTTPETARAHEAAQASAANCQAAGIPASVCNTFCPAPVILSIVLLSSILIIRFRNPATPKGGHKA